MKATQRWRLPGVGGLLSVSVTCFSPMCYAQDSASRDANNLEEVVVTAQKRSESVQDVPIAVTAMTSEQRDIVGVISIQDLTDFTPGLLAAKRAQTIEATAGRLSIPFITKHRAAESVRCGGAHEYAPARDAVRCHGRAPVQPRL